MKKAFSKPSICFLFNYWILFVLFIESATGVNVHFENKDGGFFLKQQPRPHFMPAAVTPDLSEGSSSSSSAASSSISGGLPLSIDRFTVFQSSQPISVRATYGPFSTKQTVPARYVVPDPLPLNTSGPSIDLQDQASHHLDMSAHIVRNEIPRDSPVLRVLFHTGTDPGGRRQILLARHHQRVCIVLHATMGNNTPLHAACSPDGEDGVCLAQITIPANWWPPLPSPDKDGRLGKAVKTPPRLVQVAYSVLEPWPDEGEGCHPKMQVQPSVTLGMVSLVAAKGAFKELRLTDAILMLIPHPPLFPMSRIHIPVFIDKDRARMLTAIVIRARVKHGVRLLEAVSAGSPAWNMTVDMNPKHTGATITLVRREPPDSEESGARGSNAGDVMELFTWLIEISEDASELYDGTKIVWTARFEPHQDEENAEIHRNEGRKFTTRLEVQKDDIQAVVPISKNWELLNTAVLTGQQVSQAMKVFIVSQAGKAADVTFQASCHSEDDSVLKVSSSCGSVYVDGSEARGSVNGSVLVKYGTYTGLARFTVWMPEFPLDLQVGDTRLSQLKSWRVPDYHATPPTKNRKRRSIKSFNKKKLSPIFSSAQTKSRRKRSFGNTWSGLDDLGNGVDKPACRLRYQQTPVDVYAHFMATDHDSGRISYLINRRTWLRVTDLVLPWLRVSDPRIASLHGRILQGRSVGRTEVQVLSPITSRVYGAKEIRVGNDKVGLSRLQVQVVSGLQLNISPDSSIENGYIAETSVTRKLTAQYQEGLLDIELEFSDGTRTPLRDISDSDYHLVVESLDPEVVAFAPMVASHHPRVIAVGEGTGDLLQVTLLLAEECRTVARPKMKTAGPLATAAASITVDFSSGDLSHRPDILQNDGGSYGGSKREFVDLQDILKGTPLKDDNSPEPNVQARQHQGKGILRRHHAAHLTPLEISMYVLLAAFCCAIMVFVVSCFVYASKFKPVEGGVATGVRPTVTATNGNSLMMHHRKPRETTTNAHDWVWLGRATLDNSNRNSVVNKTGTAEMRITANPLNMNYCEPEDCLATSFSNPSHIELPSRSNVRTPGEGCSNNNNNSIVNQRSDIDSSTYCKGKIGDGGGHNKFDTNVDDDVQVWNKPTPPPPLPPHGLQPKKEVDDDYRPPVPPHRNIDVSASTAASSLELASPKLKKHHQRRLDKSARNSREMKSNEKEFYEEEMDEGNGIKSVFEFDDEPQPPPPQKKAIEEKLQFVQYPRSPNSNKRNSAEVKRATIVGNPMFSNNDDNDTTANNGETSAGSDLPGLDDLQLEMDYEQIMHYFENLKN